MPKYQVSDILTHDFEDDIGRFQRQIGQVSIVGHMEPRVELDKGIGLFLLH